MPTIRISDEAWERLKRWAVPLEDTVDDALKKVLDAAEAYSGIGQAKHETPARKVAPGRRRRGGKLPQKEFRIPIMEAVYKLGGTASTKQLRPIMAERMKPRLGDPDYKLVKTGEPRWWNAICWERNDLVKEGLFRRDSERGVWELSEEGVRFIESQLKPQPNAA